VSALPIFVVEAEDPDAARRAVLEEYAENGLTNASDIDYLHRRDMQDMPLSSIMVTEEPPADLSIEVSPDLLDEAAKGMVYAALFNRAVDLGRQAAETAKAKADAAVADLNDTEKHILRKRGVIP
jgi:predicted dithiol-disulfide oxidoreductase (DUF899 family)